MNLKLHILISAAFLALIFGALTLFSASKSGSGEHVPITEDRYIQIKSATWGENCNDYILAKREEAKSKPRSETETLPDPVRRDNALRQVSSLCNGKESCVFSIHEKDLHFDPAPNCAKDIELEYRCFLTDLAHKVSGSYKNSLSIDCAEEAQ